MRLKRIEIIDSERRVRPGTSGSPDLQSAADPSETHAPTTLNRWLPRQPRTAPPDPSTTPPVGNPQKVIHKLSTIITELSTSYPQLFQSYPHNYPQPPQIVFILVQSYKPRSGTAQKPSRPKNRPWNSHYAPSDRGAKAVREEGGCYKMAC